MLPFDLETTGPLPDTARIVTAYAARIGPWPTDTPTKWNGDHWAWLADPGIPIPEAATAVHGITTETAHREGSDAHLVLEEIAEVLDGAITDGAPVIGHNIAYDLTVVDRECIRHNIEPPDWAGLLVIDTMVLDKHVWKYRKGSRRLTDVAQTYGVPIRGDAHDAAADAMAAARIGYRIAQIGATPWKSAHPNTSSSTAVGNWRSASKTPSPPPINSTTGNGSGPPTKPSPWRRTSGKLTPPQPSTANGPSDPSPPGGTPPPQTPKR
jgi:DNA polymerase-3 subunit epsilon